MPAKVSIIIPCYNASAWVVQTVESALAQTQAGCEVIVVDDGSKDNSVDLLRPYESRGVRVVSQANAGASAARNHGLRLAQGEYIQFLDADDLLLPEKIERQVALLEREGSAVIASGEWARFCDDPAQAVFGDYPVFRDMSGVEFLQLSYEQQVMMQPGAWLSPRTLLDRASPWDESLSLNDDGEYFARVMLTARAIRFCPGARLLYRSGVVSSLSRKRGHKYYDSLYRSMDLTLKHLLEADRSPRTVAAAAYAWKWTAFELYPGAPDLARFAEQASERPGGSSRELPAGPSFQRLAKFIGWRLAKRIRNWSMSS